MNYLAEQEGMRLGGRGGVGRVEAGGVFRVWTLGGGRGARLSCAGGVAGWVVGRAILGALVGGGRRAAATAALEEGGSR